MAPTISDVRRAAQNLARVPAFSAAALLCLALGVGATAAVFSAVKTALLVPLPFSDPGRLVTVYRTTPHFTTGPFSAANYLDLSSDTRSLEGIAATTSISALIALPDRSVRASARRVTGNFFGLLGAGAKVGRLLGPGDDLVDQPSVVVLSEEFWREHFGSDPGIVGGTIPVDGSSHEVVGIVASGFRVPHGHGVIRSDLWVPMRFSDAERARRRSNYLSTFGRLAPGSTVEAADAELKGRMIGIVEAHPQVRGEQVRVVPLQAEGVRAVRKPLLLLLGAVGFVLLIAAAERGELAPGERSASTS